MRHLKVAMVAPPWLKTPPQGYGGTERVVDNLCKGLKNLGVRVELFAVKGSNTPASRYHWLYEDEQFEHIHKLNTSSIPAAQMLFAIEQIKRAGNFDIIHDHVHIMGPAMLSQAEGLPPVLHTLHGPFNTPDRVDEGYIDEAPFFRQIADYDHIRFNGISRSQLRAAPTALRRRLVGAIHHGIDVNKFKFFGPKDKSDYFVNVGRVAREKGIEIAAKISAETGSKFKLAGTIASIGDPDQVVKIMADSSHECHGREDFAYYRDKIVPHLKEGQIEFVGSTFGPAKDKLIGQAKAFLMPIQWEEPFGVAVIESLAVGTPVIAFRRGSMPEIIQHGVNGFLAETPEEFAEYMKRADEIDPAACRRSVEQRFSYEVMAEQYLATYRKIIAADTQQITSSLSPLAERPLSLYQQLKKGLPVADSEEAS